MSKEWKTTFDAKTTDLVDALDEVPFWSAPFGLKLLEVVRLKKDCRALDIGFGTGYPLIELASRLGSSARVYGIDPWHAAIRRCRKKIRQFGISNIELIEGKAEDIPLEKASIDLVVSNNGINNVEDMARVLEECFRVLTPGGQFVLSMNLDATMVELYNILEAIFVERKLHEEILRMRQHIYDRRKPLEEVLELLRSSGFHLSQQIFDRFEYRFADGSALLNHHIVRISFLDGWHAIVRETERKAVFRELENRMNAETHKAGCFVLSVPFVILECTKPR